MPFSTHVFPPKLELETRRGLNTTRLIYIHRLLWISVNHTTHKLCSISKEGYVGWEENRFKCSSSGSVAIGKIPHTAYTYIKTPL